MSYKTRLCQNYNRGAFSRARGSNCTFAHGVQQLRGPAEIAVDSSYRNEQHRHSDSIVGVESSDAQKRQCARCTFPLQKRQFLPISRTRFVPYPFRPTQFRASLVESNRDNSWKTQMCHMWQKTHNCQFGEKCRYAHGYQELRKRENEMGNSIAASKSPFGHPTSNALAASKSPIVQPRSNIVAASKSPIVQPTSNASASKNRNVKKKNGYLSMDCPHKISQVYGDWIDDEPPASHVDKQANKEHNS